MSSVETSTAERIREWRKIRGMTQKDLAERISYNGYGISNTQLSKIEKGTQRITVGDLFAIARGLDVRPSDLCPDPHAARSIPVSALEELINKARGSDE